MPRRDDIQKILLVGSGPIIIGQACEFDYSGTQACKALREEGFEVVLVNSNPATIMTDPETADRTYIEPLTPEMVERVIAKERPDALLPTMGGQTALNLTVALAKGGVLEKYGVEPSWMRSKWPKTASCSRRPWSALDWGYAPLDWRKRWMKPDKLRCKSESSRSSFARRLP